MRPIKLVISAFGPYRDEVVIDFEKFGSSGIYLITGETGSGKTTIFDAISFALYGEASGSRRENSSFRSDFAKDDVKTFVKLIFVHKEVIYEIERVPKYIRKKLRGDGFTTVTGDATLLYLDNVISGDKNVNDKVIEILGINAKQFKQIVMIAQGEFLELLLAKPKDRAAIFRHIFDTSIYKNISDSLKSKYLEIKREYEDSSLSLNHYLESINWNEEKANDTFEEIIDKLTILIEEDKIQEKKLLLEKNKENEALLDLVKRISEVTLVNDSIKRLEIVKNNLEEYSKKYDNFAKDEELLIKNKELYEKVIPLYEKVKMLRTEIENKLTSLENNEVLLKETEDKYKESLIKYNFLSELEEELYYLKLKKSGEEDKLLILEQIEEIVKEINELLIKVEQCEFLKFKDLKKNFEELDELKKKFQDLQESFKNKKNIYFELNQKYMIDYDLFLSSQAGILAANLKEGSPCPVCGSLTHPNPCKNSSEVIGKEELDIMKTKLEVLSSDIENISVELNEINFEINKKELLLKDVKYDELIVNYEKLEKKYSDCLINENILKELDQIEKKISQLDLVLVDKKKKLNIDDDIYTINKRVLGYNENIDTVIEKIKFIQEQYKEITDKRSRLKSIIIFLRNEISELQVDLKQKEKNYKLSYQELGYKEESNYLCLLLERKDVNKLEELVSNYLSIVKSAKAEIRVLEEVIGDKKFVDVIILENKKLSLEEKLMHIDLSLNVVNSRLNNNIKIFNHIKDVSEKTTNLEKKVMLYKDLSDTANGTLVGKNKLEFEQFVQAGYFDLVIRAANKRLLLMTEDRYQLIRKEEAIKISDRIGLELEVIDYYTGKRRDVKSLSGGESFKASLSLALGMSDTIQEYAGGIVVETMFIDEGFGSLDDNSLDQAMNAITLLCGDNKIIGIISHVEELKRRIDKKIVVKKGSTGSLVNVIV